MDASPIIGESVLRIETRSQFRCRARRGPELTNRARRGTVKASKRASDESEDRASVVRFSSPNGRKMFEAPPLISVASAFGSSLKTWVVTALCGRRRVDFCGNPAVTYVGPILARKLLCISKLRRWWSPVVLRSLNDCITCYTSVFTPLTSLTQKFLMVTVE
jgi:hypothetical protein